MNRDLLAAPGDVIIYGGGIGASKHDLVLEGIEMAMATPNFKVAIFTRARRERGPVRINLDNGSSIYIGDTDDMEER